MICPIREISWEKGEDAEVYECHEECAWYDGKQCAILSIVKALESIANSISNGVKR